LRKAQRLHQFHAVAGHLPFGIVGVPLIGRWSAAVAITAQVGGDHGEMLGQLLGDLVPDDVGLRVPVQQQEAGAAAAEAISDVHAIDMALVFDESGKHRG